MLQGNNSFMELAYKILIKGRVTGVGFRYSTLDKCADFPTLKGYVRNLGRGEVEVFLQGGGKDVNEMISWLKIGPPYSRVDEFECVPTKFDQALRDFHIS